MKKNWISLFINIIFYLLIALSIFGLIKFMYHSYFQANKRIIINDFHTAVYEQDMTPTSDENGKKVSPYKFIIENISLKKQEYELYLKEVSSSLDDNYDEINTIPKEILKYQLIKNGVEVKTDYLSNLKAGLLDYDIIDGLEKNNYIVRIWIDKNAKYDEWNNKAFNYQFSIIEK